VATAKANHPPALALAVIRPVVMVKKLIFASKQGEFPRPKAHARFPLIVVPRRNPVVL
jgi:hypothetical protein